MISGLLSWLPAFVGTRERERSGSACLHSTHGDKMEMRWPGDRHRALESPDGVWASKSIQGRHDAEYRLSRSGTQTFIVRREHGTRQARIRQVV